ncbi:hypothetical protein [Vibrio gallaecicus]|nr:hypothetical protein [Vibrio gallaecicus]MDN3617609.1 hypothetical protein [Vibrio gallaecicus]
MAQVRKNKRGTRKVFAFIGVITKQLTTDTKKPSNRSAFKFTV